MIEWNFSFVQLGEIGGNQKVDGGGGGGPEERALIRLLFSHM